VKLLWNTLDSLNSCVWTLFSRNSSCTE